MQEHEIIEKKTKICEKNQAFEEIGLKS